MNRLMEQSQGRVNIGIVQEMTHIHRSLPQRCGSSRKGVVNRLMEQSQGWVNIGLVQEMTHINRSLPQRCSIRGVS